MPDTVHRFRKFLQTCNLENSHNLYGMIFHTRENNISKRLNYGAIQFFLTFNLPNNVYLKIMHFLKWTSILKSEYFLFVKTKIVRSRLIRCRFLLYLVWNLTEMELNGDHITKFLVFTQRKSRKI